MVLLTMHVVHGRGQLCFVGPCLPGRLEIKVVDKNSQDEAKQDMVSKRVHGDRVEGTEYPIDSHAAEQNQLPVFPSHHLADASQRLKALKRTTQARADRARRVPEKR